MKWAIKINCLALNLNSAFGLTVARSKCRTIRSHWQWWECAWQRLSLSRCPAWLRPTGDQSAESSPCQVNPNSPAVGKMNAGFTQRVTVSLMASRELCDDVKERQVLNSPKLCCLGEREKKRRIITTMEKISLPRFHIFFNGTRNWNTEISSIVSHLATAWQNRDQITTTKIHFCIRSKNTHVLPLHQCHFIQHV